MVPGIFVQQFFLDLFVLKTTKAQKYVLSYLNTDRTCLKRKNKDKHEWHYALKDY
jgi:hypothetical protein